MSGLQNGHGGGPNARERFEVESRASERSDLENGCGGHDHYESGRDANGHGGSGRDVNGHGGSDRCANDRSVSVRDPHRHGGHAHSLVGGLHGNGSNDRARHGYLRHANARRVSDHGGHVQKPTDQQD